MEKGLPTETDEYSAKIELAKLVLLAAIEYALIHNLPLPSDIYKQYLFKGEVPSWIEEHYQDEAKKHHHYYKFALDEYKGVISLLTGSITALDKPLKLESGVKLLDFIRRHFVRKISIQNFIDSMLEGGSFENVEEQKQVVGNSYDTTTDSKQDGEICIT